MAALFIAREFEGLGMRYLREDHGRRDWVASPNLATDFGRFDAVPEEFRRTGANAVARLAEARGGEIVWEE